MTVLCINISLGLISCDTSLPVPRNSGTNFQLEGANVTGSKYNIIHFYCIVVEFVSYSDVVECLPVNPVGLISGWGR